MEVSALRYSGGTGLQSRSPLLKLQSDERLVALVRRGNVGAFETLVGRYEARLLSFCRHLLGSREDAEDVLQEVLTAAYNAMRADTRAINVRPWLYRIARNRCLNHLRKATAVGVDSMDVHFSDHGATTADKVHEREEFRLLVGDIQRLPETQRTALVLREMDALSYDQIAETMDTTVSSVKSLLVRARVSLAESAEARTLTCEEVRDELGQLAERLIPRMTPPVRRHIKTCARCEEFQVHMKRTNKALAALFPVGLIAAARQLIVAHLGHSGASAAAGGTASSGTTAGTGLAAGTGAAGTTAGAGATGVAGAGLTGAASGGGMGGFLTAGAGVLATKAAAGVAVATLLTAGTVAVTSHTGAPAPPAHAAKAGHAGPAANHAPGGGAAGGAGGPQQHNGLFAAQHHRKPDPKHQRPAPTHTKSTATATSPTATRPVTTQPSTTQSTTVPSTTTPESSTTTHTTTTHTPTTGTSTAHTTTTQTSHTTTLPEQQVPSGEATGTGTIGPGSGQTGGGTAGQTTGTTALGSAIGSQAAGS